MDFNLVKNLQNLNFKGFVPGHKETEKEFFQRVELLENFFSYPPPEIDYFLVDTDWLQANQITSTLFDFSMDWIVSYYSNRHLSFYQGAATWIFLKEGVRVPLIQLKKALEKGTLLKIYRRQEILAHEAVHALRMQFDDPLFEEILAYKTSPYGLRRFLAPIFQSPKETLLVLLMITLSLVIEALRIFSIENQIVDLIFYLPLLLISLLFCRLCFLQLTLCIALKKMKKWLLDPQKDKGFAVRLSDFEIFRFAYQRKQKLIEFLQKQKSFRWQTLKKIYLKTLK